MYAEILKEKEESLNARVRELEGENEKGGQERIRLEGEVKRLEGEVERARLEIQALCGEVDALQR